MGRRDELNKKLSHRPVGREQYLLFLLVLASCGAAICAAAVIFELLDLGGGWRLSIGVGLGAIFAVLTVFFYAALFGALARKPGSVVGFVLLGAAKVAAIASILSFLRQGGAAAVPPVVCGAMIPIPAALITALLRLRGRGAQRGA